MKVVGAIENSQELSEGQRTALLTLLSDEDPAVYQVVRDKIVSFGPTAADWLRGHLLTREPALRRRAMEIVRHFDCQAADDRFLSFCLRHGQDFDLEEGAWLLAQTRYPDINVEAYRAMLDSFAADLRQEVAEKQGASKEVLAVINSYLFDRLGFCGNEKDYYNPENSYLNKVMDRRTGNPITLCLFYMLLTRRLRLPITGIGLPGHFVCRFQGTSSEVYIDVFNSGKLLSKADCVQYLLNASFSVKDEYLAPVSPRRLMLRICANLHQIYRQEDDEDRATRLQRYLVALGR